MILNSFDNISEVETKIIKFLLPSFELLKSKIYIDNFNPNNNNFSINIDLVIRNYIFDGEKYIRTFTTDHLDLPMIYQKFQNINKGYEKLTKLLKDAHHFNDITEAEIIYYDHNALYLFKSNLDKYKNKQTPLPVICSAQIDCRNGDLLVFECGLFI